MRASDSEPVGGDLDDRPTRGGTVLEIKGLRRRYGDIVALDGVSFEVPAGKMVGFVGRNGAGKTTTMRVVMGMVRPDEGEVRWHGAPVDHATRLRFGYLPEERGLYPKMRVRDQLVYFARLSGMSLPDSEHSVDRWIELLGLSERTDSPVDDLSLGNQQRVQLGAALVHHPDLLILDEPFSGLDPVGVDVLADVLRREAERGAGVVFSSHQLELVERLCDDAVIIDAGRIVSQAADDLRAEKAVRVLVEIAGARTGWADHLPGVEVLDRQRDRLLVSLSDETDSDALLDAARQAGSVMLFQVGSRSLADRFREVVDQ